MDKITSIVLELQHVAIDNKVRITDLLQKALVVASKLGLEDFKLWILKELEGYPDKKGIPQYRIVSSIIRAHNPFRGWIHCQFEDQEISKHLSNITFAQPIGELEALVLSNKDKNGILEVTFTQEVTNTLMKMANSALPPTRFINKAKIFGILDTIRTTVLKWTLKLEEEGILGEGLTFSDEEKEKAQKSSSVHIENYGIWGSVQAENVQIGDYSSIHEQLKDAGVSQKERNELENIFDELRTAQKEERKSILKRGFDWVERNKALIGNLAKIIILWFKGSCNGDI